MNNVELFIENERVDMETTEIVSQNFQVFGLSELKTRNSFYTDRFKLPMTSKNIQIFKWLGTQANSSNVPYRRLKAKLKIGGLDVLTNGWCKVLSMQNNHYEVCVYDSTVDFYEALEGKKITDLNFSDWNHITSKEAVSNSWNKRSEYIYALANFRKEDMPLSDRYGNNGVDIRFQMPSVFLHSVLDKIFEEAGYTYSSEILFVDLSDHDEPPNDFSKELLAPNQRKYLVNAKFSTSEPTDENIGCATFDYVLTNRRRL